MFSLTLLQFLSDAQTMSKPDITASTQALYEYMDHMLIHIVAESGLGDLPMIMVNQAVVNRIADFINRPENLPNLSATNRLKLIKRLMQVFNAGFSKGIISLNPAPELRFKRVVYSLPPRRFPRGDMKKILGFESDDPIEIRDTAIFSILADTGIRVHVVADALDNDYDVENHRFFIRPSKADDSYWQPVGETTHQRILRYKATRSVGGAEFLFLSGTNNRLTIHTIAQRLAERARKVGATPAYPYQFRTEAFTRTAIALIQWGCTDVIGELLKFTHHKSRKMVQRYYDLAIEELAGGDSNPRFDLIE